MAASEQIVCWKCKLSAGVNCLLKIGKINCLLGYFWPFLQLSAGNPADADEDSMIKQQTCIEL